ncbi:DUF2971 domain-containing protein [Pseudoalteromonas haloplanktis]|uniref:DUF2971 domain-containing protein n=1 Tax=Pseudoalteromonas haloplanktis TaxID=228 RepID=A0ABU1B9U9_PSEHA|nr:DUF2971 domain-containing protein [Pseudoalteromonas haloplanktis]MDQ9091037.1 DUF2971 domain-containing protein [Pseudoalteromonas haloplanktis]
MKLYHYMDEVFGLKNLSNRRIKASTFDNLNDPFELLGIETSTPNIRLSLNKMKLDVSRKFGILCFSKIWSNPVQWAHYANNHKGICVELDLSNKEDTREVKYYSERLKSNLIYDRNFPLKLLLSKFKHWEYEQEYRTIRELNNFEKEDGLYFQPFNENMKLSKVIIGCQSKLTRSQVESSLSAQEQGVEIIYSRPAFKSFEIVKYQNK